MANGKAAQGWLGVEDAARRLGVKPATLYAYVSRGVLARRRSAAGHSLFDPAEIERLARRGRPRRTAGVSEVVIESGITTLGDNRPYYRGRDAVDLAAWCELEEIAAWLWTGDPTAIEPSAGRLDRSRGEWRASAQAVAAGRAAQSGLPADVLPLERLQVITPALAAADPLRLTLDVSAVVDIGQSLIAGMVECLPTQPARAKASANSTAAGPAAPGLRSEATREGAAWTAPGPARAKASANSTAARLWAKLARTPPEPGLVNALRAALVLVADHELAASTLAARVAASVRADPYAAVTAALGVTGGALHGGASLAAEAMLRETAEPAQARYVMGQRLRRGERIPGFGHQIYKSGDARATALLGHIRAATAGHPRLAVADAILEEAQRRRLPEVNVDFALAVLASVSGMVTGAGEAMFAVARTVGWLAHAMEEYARPTRLRLRASYTGPVP
jgi:citrate synthase